VTFTKRRILQMWEQEKKRLQYLLPLANDYIDCLTLGYQMMSRMKPILEQGYSEDHPDEKPYIVDIIYWMRDNGWDEMHKEFNALLDQSKEYNKAHQG
jgi:hypothetical protein